MAPHMKYSYVELTKFTRVPQEMAAKERIWKPHQHWKWGWLKKLVGSYDKQFEKISNYILKALDKYLKMKMTDDEKAALENLKIRLSKAKSAYDLVRITDDGLEVTKRFKGYL